MPDPNTSATAAPSLDLLWGVEAIANELMPTGNRSYNNKNPDGPPAEETALRSVRHLIDSGAFDGAVGKVGGMIFADRAKLRDLIRKRIETFEIAARAKRDARNKAKAERKAKVVQMAAASSRRQKRRKPADHQPEAR